MNPNANEWKPSPSAASFTPGQGFQVSTPSPAPAQSAERQESNVSEIDENDALWQTVLKICEGDRDKAMKMINDPDSLAQYPEVGAVLAAGGGGEEEDDAMDTTDDAADEKDLAKDVEKMKIDEEPSKQEEEEEAEEEVDPASLKEGDPREHLNLVFIGTLYADICSRSSL